MLVKTKRRLGREQQFVGLADGGYWEIMELKRCEEKPLHC